MLAKRIIPCLDVKEGMVVKGTNFMNLIYAGDPVILAQEYSAAGADELVFLDITASVEKRGTMLSVVKRVASQVFIPFTVGGGIRTNEDIRRLLDAGADKISLNTAAVKCPALISEGAQQFGSQCIVIAIDAKRRGDDSGKRNEKNNGRYKGNTWEVYINGGRTPTGIDALSWAQRAVRLGAGEILLTSMDADGTRQGYDIELTQRISASVSVPVIASGGAGGLEDIAEVFIQGKADAALAASIFHYRNYTISDVKQFLKKKGVVVRSCCKKVGCKGLL